MRKTVKYTIRKNKRNKGGGKISNHFRRIFSRKNPQQHMPNNIIKNMLNEQSTKRPELSTNNEELTQRIYTASNAKRNLIVYGLNNPSRASELNILQREWKIKYNPNNVGFRPKKHKPLGNRPDYMGPENWQ
jgi:hypothetical protein